MNLERYEYQSGKDYLDYEFFSEGPKGVIKKGVRFTLAQFNGIYFYNLAFGDWSEELRSLNDFSVTNNDDVEKVLATVASVVMDFLEHFPDTIIYAEGSTPARTRRYQMGINKAWNEIAEQYEVFGIRPDDIIEPFRKNVNYDAFWVRRR